MTRHKWHRFSLFIYTLIRLEPSAVGKWTNCFSNPRKLFWLPLRIWMMFISILLRYAYLVDVLGEYHMRFKTNIEKKITLPKCPGDDYFEISWNWRCRIKYWCKLYFSDEWTIKDYYHIDYDYCYSRFFYLLSPPTYFDVFVYFNSCLEGVTIFVLMRTNCADLYNTEHTSSSSISVCIFCNSRK